MLILFFIMLMIMVMFMFIVITYFMFSFMFILGYTINFIYIIYISTMFSILMARMLTSILFLYVNEMTMLLVLLLLLHDYLFLAYIFIMFELALWSILPMLMMLPSSNIAFMHMLTSIKSTIFILVLKGFMLDFELMLVLLLLAQLVLFMSSLDYYYIMLHSSTIMLLYLLLLSTGFEAMFYFMLYYIVNLMAITSFMLSSTYCYINWILPSSIIFYVKISMLGYVNSMWLLPIMLSSMLSFWTYMSMVYFLSTNESMSVVMLMAIVMLLL